MKTWLILDVHFLAYRAFHTTRDLSFKGRASGVIYGFFKALTDLKDEFCTDRVAFCFEHRHLFRRDIYPSYKGRRLTKKITPEEAQARKSMTIQISNLQNRYLPRIGFKNIFSFCGMEADDIMAKIAQEATDDIVIVTADKDLYQCLRPNVSIYSPIKRIRLTEEWFVKKYRVKPWKWAVVKAIAGCASDEVEGIKGVGEITALKFLRGDLEKNSKAYRAICSREGKAIIRRNRKLVELPYEGCPIPELREDEIDRDGWRETCQLLGMKSLMRHLPISTMRRGQRR